jgi:putative ABC transport system permease protein
MDDVSHSIRALLRSPMYAIIAILTLALGIGATTAAFTVIGSVLFKPLPYAEPDRLVNVMSLTAHGDSAMLSYPDFKDFHERADIFDGFAYQTGYPESYRTSSGTQRSILTVMATEDYFPLLRATPALGRLLTPADDRAGAPPVAVLSYAMWLRDFGASPSVVGQPLDLIGVGSFTIVGVLNAGQAYPPGWGDATGPRLVYVPIELTPFILQGGNGKRSSHSDARTLARLKPGVTFEQADRELRTIARSLAAAYPADDSIYHSAIVRPLRADVLGNIGPSLAIVGLAVVLVLLLACADVANLALVRATAREREIAVRTALGAGRGQIARGLLTESALLALIGGVLGAVMAYIAVRLFVVAAPLDVPRLDEIRVDWRALVIAIAATTVAAVLCTLAPLAAVGRRDLVPALKAGSRGAGAAQRGLKLRGAIVTAQVALSVVVIAGAGLLIRSFALLTGVNPGFDAAHVVEVGMSAPKGRFADSASHQAMFKRLLAAVQIPGVASASLVNHTPLNGGATVTPVGPDGRDPATDTAGAIYEITGPKYFTTMGIPLIEGRDFTEADMNAGAVPAIISATAAKRYWPNTDPLGHEMTVHNSVHASTGFGTPIRTTVIGVATDVKKFGLDDPPIPAVYLPITHPPTSGAILVVRTTGAAAAMLRPLRRAVESVDPDLAVEDIETGEETISTSVALQRFIMMLLTVFSTIALVLAALGLYGVIAYSVTQRTSELGIRMALGARAADVVALIGRGALVLVAVGLAIGGVGAIALGRGMRSLLYGVGPNDPATLLTVAAVLVVVAGVASYLPARRAARVDPVVALRSE